MICVELSIITNILTKLGVQQSQCLENRSWKPIQIHPSLHTHAKVSFSEASSVSTNHLIGSQKVVMLYKSFILTRG